MALATATGNPPAVTHEQIESWTKLADDVTAALTMGGQQGLDFLVQLMPEWCEAVDDINTARQICIEFADRGLRDEAVHWHAKGFFEVADRLDPDRPGWEAWDAALRQRNIVTPAVDAELKEMANKIHDDLGTIGPSGATLSDHLGRLRRNMLLRGHLGERLVILESIRGLDPAGQAWQEMISPIRRRRVDAIADEVKAAISRRDFEALDSLREEVASQNWGTDLPGSVSILLDSMAHVMAIREIRGQASQAVATLVWRYEDARKHQPGSAGQIASVEAAMAARNRYVELRSALMRSMKGGCTTTEGAALVAESGAKDALRKLDAAMQEPCTWLEEQRQLALVRAASGEIEAAVRRQIEAAPDKGRSLEEFARKLKTWKKLAEDCLENGRRKATALPGGTPESTEAIFQRLHAKREELERHRDSLKRREKLFVGYFLIGLGVVVLLLVGALVVAMLAG
jgi:hypothetical protein